VACELSKSVLHGYLDGELDAARAAEFERHLETCTDCQSALEAQELLRAKFLRAELRETAPISLQAKVRSGIGSSVLPQKRWISFPRTWLAAAAAVVLGLLATYWTIRTTDTGTASDISAEQVLDAHLRSLQPGHLEDVVSTDQHTVKPWFDGRVEFAPPVNDFSSDGFPLEGGRVDVLNAKTVAALVYGRRKHVVNVFVWPAQEADSNFTRGSTRGYQWIRWRHSGMEYCAISDVSAQDLRQLAELLSRE
jgi:anti-sigma factor RsiW